MSIEQFVQVHSGGSITLTMTPDQNVRRMQLALDSQNSHLQRLLDSIVHRVQLVDTATQRILLTRLLARHRFHFVKHMSA